MTQLIQQIQTWDERTILRLISRRRSAWDGMMKFVSSMGDGYVWMIIIAVMYAFTDVSVSWLAVGLTAFAIELTCYKLIKQSTTRQRPYKVNTNILNLIVPQDEYSFPSGHTAAATVAAMLFSAAFPVLIPLCAVMTVLIGLSRVYLGVHYPSDVLMGFVLGVFSFTAANSIF